VGVFLNLPVHQNGLTWPLTDQTGRAQLMKKKVLQVRIIKPEAIKSRRKVMASFVANGPVVATFA
jgi:hypothetical protein